MCLTACILRQVKNLAQNNRGPNISPNIGPSHSNNIFNGNIKIKLIFIDLIN